MKVGLRQRIHCKAVSSGGDHVSMEVRDTGVGVPLERAESIFEAFTQVQTSGDSSLGGLDLD